MNKPPEQDPAPPATARVPRETRPTTQKEPLPVNRTLTVVIPVLNEVERLPVLLGALSSQTRAIDAIVVADAGSTDSTAEVADLAGVRVVPGGRPAAGRNAGAATATTDLILFLDADVVPCDDFVQTLVSGLNDQDLGVATALFAPLEGESGDALACEVANLYLQVVQLVSPHAAGFCILVERAVHEEIGGFDETVVLGEDHDYVQRAAKIRPFGVIATAKLPVSMRRIHKEGLVRLAFKYFYCEMYALTGTPIHRVPFDYDFAAFEKAEEAVPLVDIAGLRTRMGELARAFDELTGPGRSALERLGSFNLDTSTFDVLLDTMSSSDKSELELYLRRRGAELNHLRGRALESVKRRSDVIRLRVQDEFEQLRRRVPKG